MANIKSKIAKGLSKVLGLEKKEVPRAAGKAQPPTMTYSLSQAVEELGRIGNTITRAKADKLKVGLTDAQSKQLETQIEEALQKRANLKKTEQVQTTKLKGGSPISVGRKAKIARDGLTAKDEQDFQNMINAATVTRRSSKESSERAAERAVDEKLNARLLRESLAEKRLAAMDNKNKGGMATKSSTGHMDYRKGGLILSSVDNRKKKK